VADGAGSRPEPDATPVGGEIQPDDEARVRFSHVENLDTSRTVGRAYRAFDHAVEQRAVARLVPETRVDQIDGSAVRRQVDARQAGEGPPGFFSETFKRPEGRVLVRDHAPGTPLDELLNRSRLPPSDALDLVEAILDDLEAAHDAGVLHGNLDPSNVIVPDGNFERARAVDFALRPDAVDPDETVEIDPSLARYVSPERAGLLDPQPSPASDLYLVGLLLYEVLAGRFPFPRDTFGEQLGAHVRASPAPVRKLDPSLPCAFDQLLERAHRTDPRERYRTIEGLRADLDALRESLDGDSPDSFVVGTEDARSTLAPPSLVGRSRELSALEAQVQVTARGEGGVAVVEAVSGGGKTRLVEEFTERGPLATVHTYRGLARDEAATRPFEALRGVVEGFVDRTRETPELAERIDRVLGERAAAACEAFPELADVLDVDRHASAGPDEHGEERTLDALIALLDALGSPQNPAVVVLDDCQWADELTVRLLDRFAELDGTHTTVIVAYRSDEVEPTASLREVDADPHLDLDLLDDDEICALANSMAGPLPEEVLDVVTRLAEGNPFMTTTILRGLIEREAIVPSETGWRVPQGGLDSARALEHASEFLRHRLEHLPSNARNLLTQAAVLGKRFDPELATDLAEVTAKEAETVLAEARRRRIAWPDDDTWIFAHDKLRETLLKRLDETEQARLHAQAARRIEQSATDRVFALAYHYHEGGLPDQALGHALEAAETARERYALDAAETYYEIAAHAQPDDRETRLSLYRGLGETRMLAGDCQAARQPLETALELARTPEETAKIQGGLGELAFKRGDMVEAVEASEHALAALGEYVPSSRIAFALLAVWETLVQTTHSLLPALFVGRREPTSTETLTVRQYSRLTYASWFTRGPVPTLWAHLREFNLAERHPPTPELAQAYATHAPLMTNLPWFARGVRYAKKGAEIARQTDDLYQEGVAKHFHGLVLYGAGDYNDALDGLQEAKRLLEQTGDRWEANTAGFHIAFCRYRLGDLDDAADQARRIYEDATAIGDRSVQGLALEVWAKSRPDQVPADAIDEAIEENTGSDAQTLEASFQARGRVHLSEGELEAALDAFDEAARVRDEAGLRSEYVAPIDAWRATVLRRLADQREDRTPRARNRLLDREAKMARKAARTALAYPEQPPARLPRARARARGPRPRTPCPLLAGSEPGRRPARRRACRARSYAPRPRRGRARTGLGRGSRGPRPGRRARGAPPLPRARRRGGPLALPDRPLHRAARGGPQHRRRSLPHRDRPERAKRRDPPVAGHPRRRPRGRHARARQR